MSGAEKPLADMVFELAEADTGLSDEAKYAVVAALDGRQALRDHLDLQPTGRTGATKKPGAPSREPAGAFLTSISVAGFRGIGPEASLALHPAPGLTVVSGRNGSGKSSFAEALEVAITGGSYRWRKKSAQWTGNWRNLHSDDPCRIRIGVAIEGGVPTVLGVDWAVGAELDAAQAWAQPAGEKRTSGWDALGWRGPVESHRPMLSYDELGGLFEEGPSALYDALAKLLGLEEIYDAEKLLADELSARKKTRAAANEECKALKAYLATVDDPRAAQVLALLAKRTVDLDSVAGFATGARDSDDPSVGLLRGVRALAVPDPESAVARLRAALAAERALSDAAVETVERRSSLLAAALAAVPGDAAVACPLCGVGSLSGEWREHARAEIERGDGLLRDLRAAQSDALAARGELRRVLATVTDVGAVAVAGGDAYHAAYARLRVLDTDEAAIAEAVSLCRELATAAAEMRGAADAELAVRENRWGPVVERLARWLGLERAARALDPAVRTLTTAKKWVTDNASDLRNERLAPIAAQAREIWSQLRQESNVDLGSITLAGTRTQRRAVLEASVDGRPAGALSVMSQGELHALALALFIPRATTSTSPFRFLVLDDPVQAMDPAKIDGFVKVLAGLAATRQVIVFSHDDRLASTIRHLEVDARLVEVNRESASRVRVAETLDRAQRFVSDAHALLADDRVPDVVKERVVPGLFRLALEAAAQDLFYGARYRAGAARVDAEAEWDACRTTRQRVTLAVGTRHGGRSWADARPYRGNVMHICATGVHHGMRLTKSDANDLRQAVADLRAGR